MAKMGGWGGQGGRTGYAGPAADRGRGNNPALTQMLQSALGQTPPAPPPGVAPPIAQSPLHHLMSSMMPPKMREEFSSMNRPEPPKQALGARPSTPSNPQEMMRQRMLALFGNRG